MYRDIKFWFYSLNTFNELHDINLFQKINIIDVKTIEIKFNKIFYSFSESQASIFNSI